MIEEFIINLVDFSEVFLVVKGVLDCFKYMCNFDNFYNFFVYLELKFLLENGKLNFDIYDNFL